MKHLNLISLTLLFTKILLSISLLCFIISHSNFSSFLINYFNNYFPSFLFKSVSHAFYKSYIFFIFNGILVFNAKTSTLHEPPSLSWDNSIGVLEKHYDQILERENLVETIQEQPKDIFVIQGYQNEEKIEEDGVGGGEVYQDVKGVQIENGNPIIEEIKEVLEQVEEKEYYESEKEGSFYGLEDILEGEPNEEEVVEENNAFALYEDNVADLSTEELNKKFDEFIRKMKEELKIEAQQHIVLVK